MWQKMENLSMYQYFCHFDNNLFSSYYFELGRTSLMFAAEFGHPEIVNKLLENAADIDTTDENGKLQN